MEGKIPTKAQIPEVQRLLLQSGNENLHLNDKDSFLESFDNCQCDSPSIPVP